LVLLNSFLRWKDLEGVSLTSPIWAVFSSAFSIWPIQPSDREFGENIIEGSGLKEALAVAIIIIDKV
jgi:hypothetical protein